MLIENRRGFRLKAAILFLLATGAVAVLSACVTTSSNPSNPNAYKFFGGPDRGQFRYFAEGISEIAKKYAIDMVAVHTAGTVDNVRRVNATPKGFSIAYGTVIHRARNGKLWNDPNHYEDIMVVGYLCGSYAHLVVRAEDDIHSAKELAGKRVAVGRQGSGSAVQFKLYFEKLGNWDQIKKVYIPSGEAVKAFRNKEIDAFWVISAFPNAAVVKASVENNIRLIGLYRDGQRSSFFAEHPYFEKVVIPGSGYRGVDDDVETYMDATLWIANRHVPDDVVYKMLAAVYSSDGIGLLTSKTLLAGNMGSNNGKFGIKMPLHQGAIVYYQDKGMLAADDATPEALFAEGDRLSRQKRHREALEFYKSALRHKLQSAHQLAMLHFRIGYSYSGLKDGRKAIASYAESVRIDPDYAAAYAGMGTEKLKLGNIDGAIKDLSDAIALDRTLEPAYFSRAVAYFKHNEMDKSLADLSHAISLDPGMAQAYKYRATVYLMTHRTRSALIDLEKAIHLNANDFLVYRMAAWLYATCPDGTIRDGGRAVVLAQKAAAMAENSSTLDVLAAAYAEKGDFNQAVLTQKRAIEMLPAGHASKRRSSFERRLKSYLNRTPWKSDRSWYSSGESENNDQPHLKRP